MTDAPFSHPGKQRPDVVALGVCMKLRPADALVRPGEPCGMIHVRCAGHAKASAPERAHKRGDPCSKWAKETGGTTCEYHGANAPQVKAANKRLAQARATEAAVSKFGLPVEIEPAEALIQALYRSNGHVNWYLNRIIQQFGDDPELITWGKQSRQVGATVLGHVDVSTYRAQAPVLFDLYDRERDRLVKISVECLKIGIEQRRVRLAEEAGQRDARLLEAFAHSLGLDLQAPDTRRAVEHAFTVIDGGLAS